MSLESVSAETVGTTAKTEAAMSVHRFEKPIDVDDHFKSLPLHEAKIDLPSLKGQAQEYGAIRAKDATKRYKIPEKAETAEHARALAERILGLLIMSRYRRGPVDFVSQAQPAFIKKISDAILANEPVELILSFFGSKVRNPLKTYATTGMEVDISEMASVLRFYEIAQAIKALYAPGGVVRVACDGRKYARAIGFSEEQGRGYFERIKLMCKCLGISDCVDAFDEADHYPKDHDERTARHTERVEKLYDEGDVSTVTFVTKLRMSMALSIPIDTNQMDIVCIRYAFSTLNDEELQSRNPRALEVRKYLLRQSEKSAIKYIGVYDAVKDAGVIDTVAPKAVRATVHPKPGQLGLYAVNMHSNDVFPHHGQGVVQPAEKKPIDLNGVRLRFKADIERSEQPVHAITLPTADYPFSDGKHPFAVLTTA